MRPDSRVRSLLAANHRLRHLRLLLPRIVFVTAITAARIVFVTAITTTTTACVRG